MQRVGSLVGGTEESLGSVKVARSGWRRAFAFAGPGLMVAVGYMDPGNWATDLKGGSMYGYALLWVILASSMMAILLQTLCVRMGIVTGRDLAQTCRDRYPKPMAMALWLLCEMAIIACDVAEVIGSAIGLNLLFGIPLIWGVVITGVDVLLILALGRFGFRKLEAIVATLVFTIVISFFVNIIWAKPDWGGVIRGVFIPSLPGDQALFIAVGILGATVMPHNLYLHSSIVQTRQIEPGDEGKKRAIKGATWDTIVSLGLAFFVNAAILILAAKMFSGRAVPVEDLSEAHKLLTPLLGGAAATLFAVALLASGQSSSITGTLAGQIVMEGFVSWRITPWMRRLFTRSLAIVPAMLIVGGLDGNKTLDPLVVSQVVLSMQLPFAVVPLVMATSDKRKMGGFATPVWMVGVAWVVTSIIVTLNVMLLGKLLGWTMVMGMIALVAGFTFWSMSLPKPGAPTSGVSPVLVPDGPGSLGGDRDPAALSEGAGNDPALRQHHDDNDPKA